MSIDIGDTLEDAVIGKTIRCLLEDGYRIEMSDLDGGGLYLYAAPDGTDIKEPQHWVKFVRGNGADVISDYSKNLEQVIKEANEFALLFQ